MSTAGSLQQSSKPKVATSSATVSANASSQKSKAHSMTKKSLEKAHRVQKNPGQNNTSYEAPMLRQWLDEGNRKDANKFADRNEYAQGDAGMSKYLADWDHAWDRMGEKPDGHKRG